MAGKRGNRNRQQNQGSGSGSGFFSGVASGVASFFGEADEDSRASTPEPTRSTFGSRFVAPPSGGPTAAQGWPDPSSHSLIPRLDEPNVGASGAQIPLKEEASSTQNPPPATEKHELNGADTGPGPSDGTTEATDKTNSTDPANKPDNTGTTDPPSKGNTAGSDPLKQEDNTATTDPLVQPENTGELDPPAQPESTEATDPPVEPDATGATESLAQPDSVDATTAPASQTTTTQPETTPPALPAKPEAKPDANPTTPAADTPTTPQKSKKGKKGDKGNTNLTPSQNGITGDASTPQTQSRTEKKAANIPPPVETQVTRSRIAKIPVSGSTPFTPKTSSPQLSTEINFPIMLPVREDVRRISKIEDSFVMHELGLDVRWSSQIEEDPDNDVLRIEVDSKRAARIDLKILNTGYQGGPIISRHVEFDGGIGLSSLVTLDADDLFSLIPEIAQGDLPLLCTLAITYFSPTKVTDGIFENASSSSIEALSLFLDQPAGHDVIFSFHGTTKMLYADRYLLSRASKRFKALFGGTAVKEKVGSPATPLIRLEDDSDDEDGYVPASFTNEPLGSIPETPATSLPTAGFKPNGTTPVNTNGDGSFTTFPSTPGTGLKLVPTGDVSGGFGRDTVGIQITTTSFETFRSLLYYIYTGFIAFSPITSSFPSEDGSFSIRRSNRNALIDEYLRRYPNRPTPISPKSAYAAAKRYCLPALEALALARLHEASETPSIAVQELFSSFSKIHPVVKKDQLAVVVKSWNQVKRSVEWKTLKSIKSKDTYFTQTLVELAEALPDDL